MTGPGRRPRRRRTALVAAAVVVLVAAAIPVGRWWTHPSLFEDHGDSMRIAPTTVSQAAFALAVTDPLVQGSRTVVSFRGARAHLAVNTALARATFSICTPSREGLIGVAKADDLTRFCSSLRPLAGARMAYTSSETGDYVVLTVRPTRPGRVRVDGVSLDYALGGDHLFRRGTDTVAVDVSVLARQG